MNPRNVRDTKYASLQSSTAHRDEPQQGLEMPSQRNIHWRVPSVMLSCLFLGAGGAIGHHLFYRHWNGQEVDSASWPQEWINRSGTGFAFLVKMLLTIATGTAFVQHFWTSVNAKPLQIKSIDSMFEVLQNALQLFKFRVWVIHPVLAGLALVTWLVPIAAIISPGTLTVRLSRQLSVAERHIPQVNFTDFHSFGNFETIQGTMFSASNALYRTAVASVSQSTVLRVPSSSPNISYSMEFCGPTVRCTNAHPSVASAIGEYFSESSKPYFAFVPESNVSAALDRYRLCGGYVPTLDVDSLDTARLYLRIQFPGLWDTVAGRRITERATRTVECTLWNASYHVIVHLRYPSQAVSVESLEMLGPVSAHDLHWDSVVGLDLNPSLLSYGAIMESFGRILVGTESSTIQGRYLTATQYTTTSLASIVALGQKDLMEDTLQKMFQNITLSLLSRSVFRATESLTEPSSVLVDEYVNLYSYSPRDLYLAYGIALFAATVCVILGFVSLLRNGGCYSSSFSTILRTTRDETLDGLVSVEDTSGMDPLPEKTALSRILMVKDPLGHRFQGFHVVSEHQGEG